MIVTRERGRERGRDIGRGRSRLHAPGAQRGTQSRDSRITPNPKADAQPLSHSGTPGKNLILTNDKKKPGAGNPGWHSGLVPAFGSGRDPGDPGSNPTSGSRCMEPASLSACVSASLSLSVTIVNK